MKQILEKYEEPTIVIYELSDSDILTMSQDGIYDNQDNEGNILDDWG